MSWLVVHESQMIFVHRTLYWSFLREKCPIMSLLLHRLIRILLRLQAQMPPITTDLNTLSNGLKVVIELHQSLFSFLRAQLHKQGDIGLNVKSGDIERAICCCRDFNDEKRVGSFDEMTAFVQYDTIDIQMSSLVDYCVALSRSWY